MKLGKIKCKFTHFIASVKDLTKQVRWIRKLLYSLYLFIILLVIFEVYLFFFSPHEGHVDIVTEQLTFFSANAHMIQADVVTDRGIIFSSKKPMKFLVIADYYELYTPTDDLYYTGSCPPEYSFGFPIEIEQGEMSLKNLNNDSPLCGNLVVNSSATQFRQDFSGSFSYGRHIICESESESFYSIDMLPPEGESHSHNWVIDLSPTKVSYLNGKQISPPYGKMIVKGVVGILIYNCDSIVISYNTYNPAEVFRFYNVYDCNLVARGVLNFSLADTITTYNLTGQDVFVDYDEEIATVVTGIECSGIKAELSNDGRNAYLWLNGPVDTADLSGYTLFQTLSGLLRKNAGTVMLTLAGPFIMEFFTLFIKKKSFDA